MVAPPPQPEFDLTVRVGCSLVYEVTGTASLLLNLQPRPDRNHAVVFEALTLGDRLPASEFTDVHGNRVWRGTLAPGTNFFRHDAIVAVWAYQVARGTVGVGDPLDLSRRLDNQWSVQTETPYSVDPQ